MPTNYLLITSIFITLHIVMLPGELVSGVKKYVFDHGQKSHWITAMFLKLLTCPKCLSFWVSLIAFQDVLLSCLCFITLYLAEKFIK